MEVRIIFLFLSTTTVMCTTNHHPKVHEDVIEHSIRTVRNPQNSYRIYQPPVFDVQTARQQDYLRKRYALQQIADLSAMANRYSRNIPINLAFDASQYFPANKRTKKDTEGWQPFQPQITKQNMQQVQGFVQVRQTKNVDSSNDNLLRNYLSQEKDRKFPEASQPAIVHSKSNQNLNLQSNSNTEHGDMVGESSEVVEEKVKIDRQDLQNPYKQIVFVHPSVGNQNFVNKPNQIINPIPFEKKSEPQLTALNDLIGKNPNVQLEGLKRLLQDSPRKDYVQPVTRGPQPFQVTDRTPISEKTIEIHNPQIRPNIQLSNAGNVLAALQSPRVVSKDSFQNLQKQLDEASKLQVQQVLARAQQEAQAQVEAQHKAIALAQVQAQKVALESIQKSLYGNAPTVPLVQTDVKTLAQTEPLTSPPNALTISSNIARPSFPTSIQSNAIDEQHISASGQRSVTEQPLQPLHTRVVAVTPANTIPIVPFRNNPLYTYGPKGLLHYAPNHQHQTVAQLQAEKTLQAQVQAENNAILRSQEQETAVKQHVLESQEEQVSNFETNDISTVQSTPKPSASSAYQEITLETDQTQEKGISAPTEETHPDDLEDLQYAAKYAFGYRVKDMKEHNDFGHAEHRNGKSAEGSYHVLLPDGRLQKVKYYADDSGYHAKVTYEYVAQQ